MSGLLNRLNLANKFLILGIIALVMVAVPTVLFYRDVAEKVAFNEREALSERGVAQINRLVFDSLRKNDFHNFCLCESCCEHEERD